MRRLSFDDGCLRTLPEDVFRNLYYLAEIFFGTQAINDLPDNVFRAAGLNSLQKIYFTCFCAYPVNSRGRYAEAPDCAWPDQSNRNNRNDPAILNLPGRVTVSDDCS